jgi:hypothetical protein
MACQQEILMDIKWKCAMVAEALGVTMDELMYVIESFASVPYCKRMPENLCMSKKRWNEEMLLSDEVHSWLGS